MDISIKCAVPYSVMTNHHMVALKHIIYEMLFLKNYFMESTVVTCHHHMDSFPFNVQKGKKSEVFQEC